MSRVELERALALLRPYRREAVAATALLAVAAALPGLAVLLARQAVDDVLGGRSDRLGWLALASTLVWASSGGVTWVRTAITKDVAWRVAADLRARLHGRTLADPALGAEPVGVRLSRLGHDVDEVQYGVSAAVTAIRNPATLLVLGGTAAWMAPSLALGAVLLVPALVLPSRWAGARLRRAAAEARDARAALLDEAAQQLEGLEVLQACAVEATEAARARQRVDADRRARVRLEVERVLPGTLTRLATAGVVGLLVWWGGVQVVAGTLDPGAFVGFAAAVGLMHRPLGGLAEVWSLGQRSLAALERVFATLEAPSWPPEVPDATCGEGPAALCWEGVGLVRGGRALLEGVELAVRPGEWLTVVGPTGAGKSTLLALGARAIDPDAGRVALDGTDLRRLPLDALRRRVARVPQREVVLGRTIAENVGLGREVSSEAVDGALVAAGLGPLLATLAEGGATRVGPGARPLSGGEQQRLGLARALVGTPGALLLDEPTNQLDGPTEQAVLDALEGLRGRVTLVVVSHGPALARRADRVAVLEAGRLVELGTPEALSAAGGAFTRLEAAWGEG